MYNNSLQSKIGADVKSAGEWREYIEGGRDKQSRTIANNTKVRKIENGVAIRLHDTDIVTITDSGLITLNSGGWLSVTTKERLNRYTNARISQRLGIWYISDKAGNDSLFYDGMTISADGYSLKPRATAKYEKQVAKIKKQAKEYARGYVEALKNGAIDYPNGGDCWACLMRGPKGQESFQGSGHLQMHISDKYYVPSLLVNAGREAGYRDDQIGLMGIGGRRVFIEPERVIYKYMVKHLKGEM